MGRAVTAMLLIKCMYVAFIPLVLRATFSRRVYFKGILRFSEYIFSGAIAVILLMFVFKACLIRELYDESFCLYLWN